MEAMMAWRCRACDGSVERLLIIMVNVIPPDHVDDVPVVEPNQHDDVPVVDPLNPPPPASESEHEDVIKVENPIEHEDETVLASVYEVGESSTAPFLREDNDGLLPVEKKGKAKDEYYGKLILDLGNELRSSVEQGTAILLVMPMGWMEKFPILQLSNHLKYDSSKDDKVVWVDKKNREGKFTMRRVWKDFYEEKPKVKWIVIAATVYHIWIKRKKRLFQDIGISSDIIAAGIINDVRLKLVSLDVKKSVVVKDVANLWNVQ
ncbi:hypothetical protein Tco_0806557 [Tanacetum coccineum]